MIDKVTPGVAIEWGGQTTGGVIRIRALGHDEVKELINGLSQLLIDSVESGASVGFLMPMTHSKAEAYWRSVATRVQSGERFLLVATNDADEIVGAVQLALCGAENQSHRANVEKLLVHRKARRRGIAKKLMQNVETLSRLMLRTVLVLDTATPEAMKLYESLGYRKVGEIPSYALETDGGEVATIVYYKDLRTPAE